MTDPSADLPPGWPTEDHRSRVAARARALRNRRLGTRAAALVAAIAVVGGGFAIVEGRSSPTAVKVVTEASTTTATTVRPAPPAVRAAPTPKGWRIVDFGDARLAAPPGWMVTDLVGATTSGFGAGGATTGTPSSGVLLYTASGSSPVCSSIEVEPIRDVKQSSQRFAPRTIHGIKVYLVAQPYFSQIYAVPKLGVELVVTDAVVRDGVPGATAVLDTLTSSARRVVLAEPEHGPAVPSDWRTVTYGGVTLRVPPTMPVKQLGTNQVPPGTCTTQVFANPPRVFLGTGLTGVFNCPMIPSDVVPTPIDGVWISTVAPVTAPATSSSLIEIGDVSMWLDPSTDPMLTLHVEQGNTETPTIVRLGLGPDPTIARTILSSIRATGATAR